MNKKTIMILAGAAALVALCACVAVGAFLFYQAGQKTVDVVGAVSTQVVATLEAPTTAPAGPANPAGGTKAEVEEPFTLPDDPYLVTQEVLDQVKTEANDFFYNLIDRKYEDAVGMMTAEMRENGGTVENLSSIVEDQSLEPKEWVWKQITQEGQYIHMDGAMHFADQRRGTVRLELFTDGGSLSVSYLDLKPDGMTDPGQYNTWSADRKQEEDFFAIESAAGFLNGWADGLNEDAWLYSGKMLRAFLGDDPQKLTDYWKRMGFTPTGWTWAKTIKRTGTNAAHPTTIFTATVQAKEGGPDVQMEVMLDWEDGYWNVSAINVIKP